MNWTPHQHRLLQAMGYTVHRLAGWTGLADDSARLPPVSRVAEPALAEAALPEDPDSALLRALRKAANGRDISTLMLPPIHHLRRDPAAKRALWPQLRALRKGH